VGIRNTLTLWQPPDETIEAIAAVFSSRWSAARLQPGGLFRTQTTSWLRQQARRLAETTSRVAPLLPTGVNTGQHGITTSPAAEDSSDKHPDRRPC
jgi:hypothetical protein